jgi:hypothetical protein
VNADGPQCVDAIAARARAQSVVLVYGPYLRKAQGLAKERRDALIGDGEGNRTASQQ